MSRITIPNLIAVLGLILCMNSGAQQAAVFHGEISDSQCALNAHSLSKSHEEMLKSKAGAAGQTPASCSLYCVARFGGQFVLTSKGRTYHLDNQEMPKVFVGEKVKLHGTLDPKTGVIHVEGIDSEQ
jgi:Protein of unknown function (DUF5818)